MKKMFFIMAVAVSSAIVLGSCEGKENYDYDNQGLSEEEMSHTRKLIDSSLSKLRKELYLEDSIAKAELSKEIVALKEEIKKLKK